jgi:hypothetical protein
MRRGDFENLVGRYLDVELEARGFQLIPQPPADFDDERPAALYEANPDDFGERYPALDGRPGGNDRCVDLWVHLDPTTGSISGDLDGTPIESVAETLGVVDHAGPASDPTDIDVQLQRLAKRVAMALDAARPT